MSMWPWPTETHDESATGDGNGGEGGETLDEKAEDLAKTRPDEGVCDPRNRDQLELALAKLPVPVPATTPPPAWNRTQPIAYGDRVRSVLALTKTEEQRLAKHGFVVPERLAYNDYTTAYYDIHRGELPVYVSADSILHAVYASHDHLLSAIERESLAERLDVVLGALHCGLPAAAKNYPAEVAQDLDLYLTVARSLLAGSAVFSELGKVDPQVAPIVEAINNLDGAGAIPELELFGRKRAFDVSQYQPRGHYTLDGMLDRYFRAAMWLSRIEFNLVSRDTRSSTPGYGVDPRETPREAVVALALADLVIQTGVAADLAAIDSAWTTFAGVREDISIAELDQLRTQAKIGALTDADAAAKLRTAIGDRYQRTVNVHPNPNVARLPAIATLLGPRITPDTVALNGLAALRGPDLRAAEVAYMLGSERGLAYTEPQLGGRLLASRDKLQRTPRVDDLYSAWLDAIGKLAIDPPGAKPSFMATETFADMRLNTMIAAYGQLRHNHVLIQAQMYDVGGCEIPDGYVEPAVDTYRALAEYARRGKAAFAKLDPKDVAKGAVYFTRLERLMNVFIALSLEELANRPLSTDAKRFLSMIVEMREGTSADYQGTFPIATYDGWYVDLFAQMQTSFDNASFIADYATFDREGARGVHYIGAKSPRLGVFVIDVGGKPRAMVGPVANAFQHTGGLDKRLADEDVPTVTGSAPWQASYTVAAPAEPTLAVEFYRPRTKPLATGNDEIDPMVPRRPGGGARRVPDMPANTIRIDSAADHGTVTFELLDHHFVKLATVKARVKAGRTDVAVRVQPRPIEAIRVISGKFSGRVDLNLEGYAKRQFGR